ncbi:hypothetical protein ACFW16_31120 [Inquilinus sp. NPDC058860]|uniref:hypothetical protein n=1 Tax=Inquilinus sp. NPDC058860 TaxID=3346652 RepID=UPI0036BB4B0B
MPEDNPQGRPPTLNKTEARQGETSGRMRWVLHASMGLVVVAFGIILLWWVF